MTRSYMVSVSYKASKKFRGRTFYAQLVVTADPGAKPQDIADILRTDEKTSWLAGFIEADIANEVPEADRNFKIVAGPFGLNSPGIDLREYKLARGTSEPEEE